MGNYYNEFDSTPANIVADLKTQMLNSSDWSNISGGTGNVMSATTTRGAQMAVDLADAAATSRTLQVGIYRVYSAGSGTDKALRYVCWHPGVSGATTDPIHVALSLGKEHFYLAIEGPRAGEPNPDDGNQGTNRQCLFLGDIVPYFAGDTVPAVALIANASGPNQQQQSDTVWVSRNAANNQAWVTARLGTLCQPILLAGGNSLGQSPWVGAQRAALGDGNTYLWPYVVIEDTAGIRGRISKAFFSGFTGRLGTGPDFPPSVYQRLTYNSENYILLAPHRGSQNQATKSGFGWTMNQSGNGGNTTESPVIAVPTA